MYLVLVDAMDRSFVAKNNQKPSYQNGMKTTFVMKRVGLHITIFCTVTPCFKNMTKWTAYLYKFQVLVT